MSQNKIQMSQTVVKLGMAVGRAVAGDITALIRPKLIIRVLTGIGCFIVFMMFMIMVLSTPFTQLAADMKPTEDSLEYITLAQQNLNDMNAALNDIRAEVYDWLDTQKEESGNAIINETVDLYLSVQEISALWSARHLGELTDIDEFTRIARLYIAYESDIAYSDTGDKTLTLTVWTKHWSTVAAILGFDETETIIAANMIQGQLGDILTDTPGNTARGTDIGDITFTDGVIPVVYYNQNDIRWCNQMYGKSGTIGKAGCGPTAVSIVVSSFTAQKIDPSYMAPWAAANGYRAEGSGSYHTLISLGVSSFGLLTEGASRREGERIKNALRNGKLVIAHMGKGTFTSGGHYIVLRGITADGQILVADPSSLERSRKSYPLDLILRQASQKADKPFSIVSRLDNLHYIEIKEETD